MHFIVQKVEGVKLWKHVHLENFIIWVVHGHYVFITLPTTIYHRKKQSYDSNDL